MNNLHQRFATVGDKEVNSKTEEICIYINTRGEKSKFGITVSSVDTIRDVKSKIADQTSFFADHQHLFFKKNDELLNDKKIHEYGVVDGSTLWLTVRAPGCDGRNLEIMNKCTRYHTTFTGIQILFLLFVAQAILTLAYMLVFQFLRLIAQ